MASKRRKKEALMGRVLITLGLLLKIIQIVGSALSLSALGGTAMTLITTCLLVGGLAVLAIERMSIVSAFALISLVGIIGGILPAGDYKYSFIFMCISIVAYAVMLISMKRKGRMVAAVFVLLFTVLLALQSFGVITMPLPLVATVLSVIYGLMGAGLYL